MKKKLLTTKLDKPCQDKENIYLGQWCFNHLCNGVASQAVVVPYPLAKPKQLNTAYNYLQNVYDNLLPQLVALLNNKHGGSRSSRYWEIIIGYWLREYIEVLYERYVCIKQAITEHPDLICELVRSSHYVTVENTKTFSSLAAHDDNYNKQLYSQIIFYLTPNHYLRKSHASLKELYPSLNSDYFNANNIVKNLVRWGGILCAKFNKTLFTSSYLPLKTLIACGVKLKFFPTLDVPSLSKNKIRLSRKTDHNIVKNLHAKDVFEDLVINTLQQNLPWVYWEGFSKLKKCTQLIYPNRKTRLIVTANSFATNEAFKLWTAEQIERHQAKYIILQHGGHYGCGKWNSSEDFEIKTADNYLSYGWKDKKNNKVIPFIANRFQGKNNNTIYGSPTGKIIWVLASFPRYTYTMYSSPSGPLFLNYLEEQTQFIAHINENVRKKLLCRPYQHNYGWHDLTYIAQRSGHNISQANTKKTLLDNLKQAQLCICTYNATAHLEAFANNIPTLLYWNPEHWALRDSAKEIHKQLHDVGILHYSPTQAAQKLNEIFDHTHKWWAQPEIQKARQEFCAMFAQAEENMTEPWVKKLTALSTD